MELRRGPGPRPGPMHASKLLLGALAALVGVAGQAMAHEAATRCPALFAGVPSTEGSPPALAPCGDLGGAHDVACLGDRAAHVVFSGRIDCPETCDCFRMTGAALRSHPSGLLTVGSAGSSAVLDRVDLPPMRLTPGLLLYNVVLSMPLDYGVEDLSWLNRARNPDDPALMLINVRVVSPCTFLREARAVPGFSTMLQAAPRGDFSDLHIRASEVREFHIRDTAVLAMPGPARLVDVTLTCDPSGDLVRHGPPVADPKHLARVHAFALTWDGTAKWSQPGGGWGTAALAVGCLVATALAVGVALWALGGDPWDLARPRRWKLSFHASLGKGSFGEVYRATVDGHEVAVKVFREPVAMADVAPLLADPDRPSAVWPRGRVPRGTLGVLQLGARVDEDRRRQCGALGEVDFAASMDLAHPNLARLLLVFVTRTPRRPDLKAPTASCATASAGSLAPSQASATGHGPGSLGRAASTGADGVADEGDAAAHVLEEVMDAKMGGGVWGTLRLPGLLGMRRRAVAPGKSVETVMAPEDRKPSMVLSRHASVGSETVNETGSRETGSRKMGSRESSQRGVGSTRGGSTTAARGGEGSQSQSHSHSQSRSQSLTGTGRSAGPWGRESVRGDGEASTTSSRLAWLAGGGGGRGPTRGHVCMAMELCDMGDLRECLSGEGGPSFHTRREDGTWEADLPLVMLTLIDVAEGAAYLHSRNVVHCDIKASNIMLCSHAKHSHTERELLGGQCFGSEGAERDAWEGRRRAVSPYANRAGKAFLAKIVDFSVSRAMQGSATHHPRDHGRDAPRVCDRRARVFVACCGCLCPGSAALPHGRGEGGIRRHDAAGHPRLEAEGGDPPPPRPLPAPLRPLQSVPLRRPQEATVHDGCARPTHRTPARRVRAGVTRDTRAATLPLAATLALQCRAATLALRSPRLTPTPSPPPLHCEPFSGQAAACTPTASTVVCSCDGPPRHCLPFDLPYPASCPGLSATPAQAQPPQTPSASASEGVALRRPPPPVHPPSRQPAGCRAPLQRIPSHPIACHVCAARPAPVPVLFQSSASLASLAASGGVAAAVVPSPPLAPRKPPAYCAAGSHIPIPFSVSCACFLPPLQTLHSCRFPHPDPFP